MNIAARLNGIGEYYFSQKLREIEELNKAGKQIINLGIGSPDMPPHPAVIKTLQDESAKANVHAYQSYKGSPILRNAISQWYQKNYSVTVDPNSEILPLLGSKEGIMHICMTFFEKGDAVLIPNPGYPTYAAAVKIAGATTISYDLLQQNDYQPDFDALGKLMDNQATNAKIKGMFINYPHMPTGQLPLEKTFEKLVDFAIRHQILLIHDNPYSFILNDQPKSILGIPNAKAVAIELNSLSKSHNMAGWRLGMLCASPENIDAVLRFKSNMDSGMFLPIQLAAAKALSLDDTWTSSINDVYKKRREKVFELLSLLNCTYDKSQAGMFVWAAIPTHAKDGYELSDQVLYKANVFLTPGGIFGSNGNRFIRVSLCATEENIINSIERIKQHI